MSLPGKAALGLCGAEGTALQMKSEELLPHAACAPKLPPKQPLWLCRVARGQASPICPCCFVQQAPPVHSVTLSPCACVPVVFLSICPLHLIPCLLAFVPVALITRPALYVLPYGCAPNLHRPTQRLCLCRVAVGGPLIPEGRHPPAFRVATLPAGDSVTWQFTCRVGACARMTVQPYLDLPARAAVIPGERLQQHH